jgi:hypothetical protein
MFQFAITARRPRGTTMLPADPVTLLVTSYVMPAALTTYLFWSLCAIAAGRPKRQEAGRRRR